MNNLTAQKAAEILNQWIADCDRHGTPGNYEIRRANSGEDQIQASKGYHTLGDVLHRFGVPGF